MDFSQMDFQNFWKCPIITRKLKKEKKKFGVTFDWNFCQQFFFQKSLKITKNNFNEITATPILYVILVSMLHFACLRLLTKYFILHLWKCVYTFIWLNSSNHNWPYDTIIAKHNYTYFTFCNCIFCIINSSIS